MSWFPIQFGLNSSSPQRMGSLSEFQRYQDRCVQELVPYYQMETERLQSQALETRQGQSSSSPANRSKTEPIQSWANKGHRLLKWATQAPFEVLGGGFVGAAIGGLIGAAALGLAVLTKRVKLSGCQHVLTPATYMAIGALAGAVLNGIRVGLSKIGQGFQILTQDPAPAVKPAPGLIA